MAYDFVDFGCGRGNSYKYAAERIGPNGLGVDNSAEQVLHCASTGLNAEYGDILNWDKKNIAAAAIAFDVMPFIGALPHFRLALTNIVRSSTAYAVIQHTYFDDDNIYFKQNMRIPSPHSKKIQIRPMSSDYIEFFSDMNKRLDVVGVGIFGVGKVAPVTLTGESDGCLNADVATTSPIDTWKSLRVVVGRKKIDRFNSGLNMFSTPNLIYYNVFG